MTKARRGWTWAPAKPSRVPEDVKDKLTAMAGNLIDSKLKPQHVKPPPKKTRFNYLVDIFTKWHGAYFYLVSKYACPGPNSISPFFEIGFARFEYQSDGRFRLAYMRHTGKWWEIFSDLTMDEALETIGEDSLFQP